MDPSPTQPVEKGKMSNLAIGFAARMPKWATSAQVEANPGSEVPSEKGRKWSGSGGEVQESQAVVTLDSPERASKAIPALKGATQEASREVSKALEDAILAGGPSDADIVVREASLEIAD